MRVENSAIGFKAKEIDTLRDQFDQADDFSKSELNNSLIPPTIDTEKFRSELVQTPYDILITRFPKRMEIYGHILKTQKREGLPYEEQHTDTRWLHLLNSLDYYIQAHRVSSEEERTLYDRQFSVFEELRNFLEEGNTEGYIKLPTGTGKTVLFTEFVEATGLKTMIVVPTQILVEQTDDKFEEFAPDIEVGLVYEEEKDYTKPVTIITYNSLLTQIANGKINPEEYDLLILDEAHKSLTNLRSAAVNQFTNAIKIGFTATPRYSQDKHTGDLLMHEIHTMGIREAVEEGMLSSVSVILAQTEVDLSDVKVTVSGDYLDRDLDRAINIESRNTAAVNLYEQMFLGQTGVAYCVSIEHARDLAELFNKRGIPAAVVFGNQYRVEQKEILEKFRKGEIQVVCNADLLIEGFDNPSAIVCLNLRPTSSPVVAEQRAGRVLRYDFKNPNKHAYVVDFLDRHRNPDFFPVSFAQIIEGVHVFKKHADDRGGEPTGGGTPHYPPIEIEGLKVITDAEEVIRIINTMNEQKYPEAQPEWMTVTALWRRFRMAVETIQRVIESYRESNPENFKIVRNPRGQIYEHLSPELVQIIADMKTSWRTEVPIEGWLPLSHLARKLNSAPITVRNLVDSYRKENPEYVRMFRRGTGFPVEHISPELASLIEEKLKIGIPPEGWISFSEASKALGIVKGGNLHRFMRRYNIYEQFPEDFLQLRVAGTNYRTVTYLSPRVFQLVVEKKMNTPEAPEGWVTSKELAVQLSVSIPIARKLAQKYAEEYPDSIGMFRTIQNTVFEHYSPDLIQIIKSELTNLSQAPDDWMKLVDFASQHSVSIQTLRKQIVPHMENNPEYFSFYFKDSNGKLLPGEVLYISPEIVSLLKDKWGKIPEPQEGWMLNSTLATELCVSVTGISYFINKYRSSHPEFFQIARGPSKKFAEYLSPELVEKIRKHFISDQS